MSISGSSFGTISHPGSYEIGWIWRKVFRKYVILNNVYIYTVSFLISFPIARKVQKKEGSCFFLEMRWSLVDLSIGFEPTTICQRNRSCVGFPMKHILRILPEADSHSSASYDPWIAGTLRKIQKSRHLGNRSYSISLRSVCGKEGSHGIDLSCLLLNLWLIDQCRRYFIK